MNPRMFSPCLLAAKDDLTNSVDVVYFKYRHIFDIVENKFALDNLHLENKRKSKSYSQELDTTISLRASSWVNLKSC